MKENRTKSFVKTLRGIGRSAAAWAAGVTVVPGMLLGNYFFNLALNPRHASLDFSKPRAEKPEKENSGKAEIQPKSLFAGNPAAKTVSILSGDGLRLSGEYVPSEQPGDRWIITVHGYRGRHEDMGSPACAFHQMGFHVLAPDLRGHGKSEGTYVGMGWHDRLDLLKWIDYVLLLSPEAEIVLHGVSMGGAAVMMTAGEKLPPNVKAIVEDCGYSSVKDEFRHEMRYVFGMSPYPVLWFADLMTRIRAGYGFGQASAVRQLQKNHTVPMLFLHGEADRFVPFRMQQKCFDAAACPKERLSVPGAGHAESVAKDPRRVWGTLYSFLSRYVDGLKPYRPEND